MTTEALVRVIRAWRPHVMTTYDEKGGYPHPDHIMCHTVSMAAFEAAGDPTRYPHAGEPWQPLKIYYNGGWTKDRLEAIHDAMLAEGLESPYAEWLANWKPRRSGRPTTTIACGEYFETRDRALMAHATQVDPDGFWFQVPLEIQTAGLGRRGVRGRPVLRRDRRRGGRPLRRARDPRGGRRARDPHRPRARPRRPGHRRARARGGRAGVRPRPRRQLRHAHRRGRRRATRDSEKADAR